MIGALGNAISALQAQAQKLSTSATNVANVQTPGYKSDEAYLETRSPNAGGGVRATVSKQVGQQGPIQQTQSPTDLAISGNGFFVVDDPNNPDAALKFTRAGDFQANAQGYLVNSAGQRLQGFRLDAQGNPPNVQDASNLEPVNVAVTGISARQTTNVDVNLNLDADTPVGNAGPDFTRSVAVYDSLGAEQEVTLEFTRTSVDPNEFELDITDANGNNLVATQTLEFDGDGVLSSADTINVTGIDFGNGSSAQDITFDISNISQNSGDFSVTSISQNGAGSANLAGVSIDDRGIVTAQFANGQEANIYQVPLATFTNPEGLQAENGQAFGATQDSGTFNLNGSNQGMAGSIQPSAIESSNVDLSLEIVKQIQSKLAFQAALKAIEAEDENFKALLDIKA